MKLTLQIIGIHLATLLVASVIATVALSQEVEAPDGCSDFNEAVRSLVYNWGESPIWLGKTDEEGIAILLFVNPVTKTWTVGTVVQDDTTAWFCGLGSGSDYTLGQEVNLSPDT